jgi:hypothetical protein
LQDADFHLATFERFFDDGLAQSVFTDMPLSRPQDCLLATDPYCRAGAPMWRMTVRGDWCHPRNQQMVQVERL